MGELVRFPGAAAGPCAIGPVDAAVLELLEAARAATPLDGGDSFADQEIAAFTIAVTRVAACMAVEDTPEAIAAADADQATAFAELAGRLIRSAEPERRAALVAHLVATLAHASLPTPDPKGSAA